MYFAICSSTCRFPYVYELRWLGKIIYLDLSYFGHCFVTGRTGWKGRGSTENSNAYEWCTSMVLSFTFIYYTTTPIPWQLATLTATTIPPTTPATQLYNSTKKHKRSCSEEWRGSVWVGVYCMLHDACIHSFRLCLHDSGFISPLLYLHRDARVARKCLASLCVLVGVTYPGGLTRDATAPREGLCP